MNLVNHWTLNNKTIIKNSKLCIVNFDFVIGKNMVLEEIMCTGLPIPKVSSAYAQIVFPCLVIEADTVTFKIGAVAINRDGNLIAGKSYSFKTRIIINASYPTD